MQEQVFSKLKKTIDTLRNQKKEVENQLNTDIKDLKDLEIAMEKTYHDIQQKTHHLRQSEKKLKQFEKMIQQSEKSVNMIIETSNKLSYALESQSSHLKSKINRY